MEINDDASLTKPGWILAELARPAEPGVVWRWAS